MQVGIKLIGAEALYDGDFDGLLELVALADRKGIDMLVMPDHVAMSRAGFDAYPGGFPYPLDHRGWFEPATALPAFAAVTRNIRLGTHILVAPLRPAILLAKQFATLDAISNGRAELGIGVGWQQQEFDASNIPFGRRYAQMEEQVEACRALWSGAPASFAGERVRFRDFYSLPLPVQSAGPPISFGVGASPRNVERMAKLGVGWCPPTLDAALLADGVAALRAAYRAAGRDPASLRTLASLKTAAGNPAMLFADAPALAAAGADLLLARIVPDCRRAEDVGPFLDRLAALKRAL